MRDLTLHRLAVVEELQLEAVVLQAVLEPARGHFRGVQLDPSGTRRLALRDAAPQQEMPGDRRAEIDQRLEIARMSVIALKKESQGCVIDRDVLRIAGNRDGKVQGVTVVPSPPAKDVARLVPRMLCNEKYRYADEYMSLCKRGSHEWKPENSRHYDYLLNRVTNLRTAISEF